MRWKNLIENINKGNEMMCYDVCYTVIQTHRKQYYFHGRRNFVSFHEWIFFLLLKTVFFFIYVKDFEVFSSM